MKNTIYTVEKIKDMLQPVFYKYGVQKASLFGSYARKSANSDSDVDLIVSLDETFGLSKYINFEKELKETLNKEVDILEYRCISEVLKDDILKEAIDIYEYKRFEIS
jgi:hypothetical protein